MECGIIAAKSGKMRVARRPLGLRWRNGVIFADVRSSSRTSDESVQIVNVTSRRRISEKLTCLVLPHRRRMGPANMALDEALLETASAGRGATACLRTYGWTTPTLSLGYFQHLDRSSGRYRVSIRPDRCAG